MGHQLILTLESKNTKDIIDECPREGEPDSLNFLFRNQSETKLFQDYSDELIRAIQTLPVTYNSHKFGLLISDFYKYDNLVSNYTILSTNIDNNGVEYVSVTEHKKYPFYTVQFHPECNLFKFNDIGVPHSSEAMEMARLMSETLVKEARLNSNSFASYQEMVSATVQK